MVDTWPKYLHAETNSIHLGYFGIFTWVGDGLFKELPSVLCHFQTSLCPRHFGLENDVN